MIYNERQQPGKPHIDLLRNCFENNESLNNHVSLVTNFHGLCKKNAKDTQPKKICRNCMAYYYYQTRSEEEMCAIFKKHEDNCYAGKS